MITYLCYVVSPIVIAGIVCLTTGRSISRNPQNRKRYLWLCGLVMTLMIGLRHYENGSGDSYYYYKLWDTMSTLSFGRAVALIASMDMEKGFLYSVWLLSRLFSDPQWVFIITGLFFSISVCFFVEKNCENVIIPLCVFNCLGLFNFMVQGMRQSIAICICLFALEVSKEKKLKKFLLLIVIAMTFHASAILFVVVYWLDKLKLDLKSIIAYIASCTIGVFAIPELLRIINTVMNESYILSGGISDGSGMIAILIYLVIVCFGLLIAVLCKGRITYTVFVYMAIFGTVALIMRNVALEIAERANYYFACSQMVIIPESIRKIKKGEAKWLISIVVVLLCFGVAIHKASYSELIPYRFFWQ